MLALVAALGAVAAIVASPLFTSTRRAEHPAFFVLGDTSTDTSDATRRHAAKLLDELARQARDQQGYIEAAAFQDFALAKTDWKVGTFDPPPRVDGDSRGTKEYLADALASFSRETRGMFAKPRDEMGTDIIGALLATEDEIASYPDASSRTVVLASNMANVAPDLVLKRTAFSPAEIDSLIDELAATEKVANLTAVCVHVVGAGHIPSEEISSDVQLSIERFWRAYFVEAGAVVKTWGQRLRPPVACEA
jgi:hypothetical protein